LEDAGMEDFECYTRTDRLPTWRSLAQVVKMVIQLSLDDFGVWGPQTLRWCPLSP
jgi:hypothetical protein